MPLVVTVSVEVPELLARDGGLNAQLAPLGKPAHESVTAALNPKVGAAVTIDVAELPAVTGVGDKLFGRQLKSG